MEFRELLIWKHEVIYETSTSTDFGIHGGGGDWESIPWNMKKY